MESRTYSHQIKPIDQLQPRLGEAGQLALELIWILLFFLVFVSATYWIWDEGRSQTQRHQFQSQKERTR